MKNLLKTCLVIAGVALLAAPFATAQSDQRPAAREGGPGVGQGRGANAKMLAEHLGLSAEQQAKVEALFKKQREALQALPQDERREKGRAIREEGVKEINALLTPEQQKKWADFRANAPRGEGRPGAGDNRREKNDNK